MSWLAGCSEGVAVSHRTTPVFNIEEMRIEWPCESSALPQQASDVRLFLSDVQGITGADLTKIIATAGLSESRERKAVAFFTPGLHESALSTLRHEGCRFS